MLCVFFIVPGLFTLIISVNNYWFTDGFKFQMHQTCVCVLQKEVGVMCVQQSSVSSILGSRLSLIGQVNLVLNTCRTVVVDSD